MKRPGTDPSRLVAIGMGANLRSPRLGSPASTLAWAAARLGELLEELRVAPLYRTAPISHLAQPDYWNTVALAALPADADSPDGGLAAPRRLLGALKALEREAGRGPAERDAPRVLDLDLLFYGSLVAAAEALPAPGLADPADPADPAQPAEPAEPAETAEPGLWRGPLVLPHPRLRQRLFVLAPLFDLAPDLALPPDGRTVEQLHAALAGSQRLERAPAEGARGEEPIL